MTPTQLGKLAASVSLNSGNFASEMGKFLSPGAKPAATPPAAQALGNQAAKSTGSSFSVPYKSPWEGHSNNPLASPAVAPKPAANAGYKSPWQGHSNNPLASPAVAPKPAANAGYKSPWEGQGGNTAPAAEPADAPAADTGSSFGSNISKGIGYAASVAALPFTGAAALLPSGTVGSAYNAVSPALPGVGMYAGMAPTIGKWMGYGPQATTAANTAAPAAVGRAAGMASRVAPKLFNNPVTKVMGMSGKVMPALNIGSQAYSWATTPRDEFMQNFQGGAGQRAWTGATDSFRTIYEGGKETAGLVGDTMNANAQGAKADRMSQQNPYANDAGLTGEDNGMWHTDPTTGRAMPTQQFMQGGVTPQQWAQIRQGRNLPADVNAYQPAG